MKQARQDGWTWFEAHRPASGTDIADQFKACFASNSGMAVLAHLRRVFLERRLGPDASADELRHLEGARSAIAYIERLAAKRAIHQEGRDYE